MPNIITFTGETVTTTSGGVTFVGRRAHVWPVFPSPNDDTTQGDTFRADNLTNLVPIDVYINIRYALPPTGDRRFEEPVRYDQPPGTYVCTSASQPVPYQTYFDELGNDGRPGVYGTNVGTYDWVGLKTKEQEDCLFYSAFLPVGPGPFPGRFHIRGGGWGVYHALAPQQYGATVAANTGCATFLPEYRNSTFGHLPHPLFLTPGKPSVAYFDILTALQHVNDYAAHWKLDTTKLCASGTSAGGAAVLMLLEDDNAQDYFTSFFCGSGGGTARYLGPEFYGPRVRRFVNTINQFADRLTSMHPGYRTLRQAIDAMGLKWALQHVLRAEDVQAMADIGPTVTAASVRAVLAGTGNLVAGRRDETENFYPFQTGSYFNAIEMAKAGKIRKPGIMLYAECEALGLLGFDYTSIRNAILATPVSTLDGWAQRLGYANYSEWQSAGWMPAPRATPEDPWETRDQRAVTLGYSDYADYLAEPGNLPFGGLQIGPGAQFNPAFGDPVVIANPDLEARRVLYTLAVFGYAAWRIARAAVEWGQDVRLMVNNLSCNSIWAGHSQEVSMAMGNPEFLVGGVQSFPLANPPGDYPNQYMDGLYASEIMQRILARLAATGDPNGSYTYAGFNQFDGNPPADGGSLSVTIQPYDLAEPGHANVLGKHFAGEPYFLNGGQFFEDGAIDLKLQRDARVQYLPWYEDAMLDILGRLEP